MEDLVKLLRAKSFMEMLSNGIDPVTETKTEDGSVVIDQALRNCFL